MPKVVVNTDRYIQSVPNQVPNQPPVARVLTRGEVLEVSDEEYERGKGAEVTNHYSVGTVSVPRREPSLLLADGAPSYSESATKAVAEARTEALLRELAVASSSIPPERLAELTASAMPAAGEGVPTLAGEPTDEPSTPAEPTAAATPAPVAPGAPPAPAKKTPRSGQ